MAEKKTKKGAIKKHDPKHLSFIHEYFYGEFKGKAERCAIIAGYKPKYANAHAWSFVGEYREKSLNKTLWDLVQDRFSLAHVTTLPVSAFFAYSNL